MKKSLLSFILGLSFFLFTSEGNSQEWNSLNGNTSSYKTEIKLLSSKSNLIRLEFSFDAYAMKEVSTPKGIANLINIPQCSRTKIKGAPDLPKISQAIALNKMAGFELNIVESEYIEFDNIELVPSKGVLTRDKNPKSIPFEYGDVYTQNAFYPSNIAEMSDSYYIRNTHGQSVVVYPVQYNPVTKKVRVYTKITVDFVEKAGVKNTMNFNPNAENDAVFESILSNHFINYTSSSAKYTPVSESGKNMLIVCYSDFMDEMAEFVTWKESIGYTVNMVNYSTIGSASALETYVQNQYDQNGISYLLLVGDGAQVPSSSTSAGDSDNNYGYTSGSDHYLDIFVGRFSADNTTDLQTQIDRTIHYERDVDASEAWIKKGVGIASNEGGSGGDDGEDDETHMNNIENDLEGFGYTMDRVYQDGGSASQLSADLNEGRGIINYVGHGSDYTWASMVYTQTNVNALTNENKLPFVVSVACVVGNFTSKTCFAETWMRATNNSNPTGAIVFCGSTINQSWASPMCAQDEMNDLLVAGTYINYGGMFVNGMFQMIDEYSSDGENMADTWTVFGDPSLQMRTPGQLDGPAGSEPTAPTANFSASATTALVGSSINFTDQSSQNPTSWSWTFEGGTPSTSTSQNPTVTYNTVGTYNVTLTATNAIGSDSETKTSYIEVVDELPVEYCESKGTDYSYEWIASVVIGDYSKTSTGASYTDFTSETIEMTAGIDYAVSLTPGFASSTYNEYWKIWVDLNKDGDFDDTDELIYDAGALSKTEVTGTATIPEGTSAKTTRMRVSMKYNAAQTACETFSYGEVEDYTVVIKTSTIDTEAPTAPSNLTASNITQTTLDLSWNASSDNVGVTAYEVFQGSTSLGEVTGTTAQITGLIANTSYSYYVKAKDAAGNISAASSNLNVTTLEDIDTEAPTAPSSLAASNVGTSSFTLSWNASSDNVGVTGYDVYQGSTVITTTTSTSYNVTGLSPNTSYSYYVKAKDAAGNISAASSIFNVTTLEDIDTEAPTAPSNLAASNVGTTSLTLSWNASSDNIGVTGYDVYQGSTVITTTTTTSYNVTGLSLNTTYSYSVKAKDAAGNVSSESSTLNVTTLDDAISYCSSQGNNSTYEWIAGVVIGSFENTSGAANYTDYTSMIVNLETGNTNVALTPGFSGSTYNEYWKIWIDLNVDGDFDDSDELVYDAGSMSKSSVSGTIVIPTSAEGVTSRMRVSMKYNGAQTACESFSYGEVEDYTVSIAASVPDTEAPTTPTNLTSSNVSQNSVDLSWNASTDNVGVKEYEVFQGGISKGTVTGTTMNISGLSAASTYTFYVKAEDAAGNVSTASSSINVTTLDEVLTYCSTKGNNVNYEWIDLVQLNEIDNSTSANGGYADFTNLTANVSLGSSQTINFSCGFNSSSYTEYWHVWIDWDHSGTFDTDEEMVTGSSSSSETLSGDFTVPSDALIGNTRMRVTMKYNAAASACETFTYGEVEDYTINVSATGFAARSHAGGITLGNEESTSLVVYPNPAQDFINVMIKNGSKVGIINIYDMSGMFVKAIDIDGSEQDVSVSELPAGSYIISVEDERGSLINKIVKQ